MNRTLLLVCSLSLLSCRPKTAVEVPLLAQRSNVWCWAACMEMILKFHRPDDSTTQCELASRYARIRNQGHPLRRLCCENLCQDPCDPQGECLPGCSGSELQTIEFFWSFLEQDGVSAQYLDLLFSEKGFQSVEEVNWPEQPGRSISWELIKKQIRACLPFILLINRSGEIDGVQQHAVVATGIHEKRVGEEGDPLQFVLVNDPWRRCEGCEYLLPYALFEETDNTAVNRVLALVHSIRPREAGPCIYCPAPKRKMKRSTQGEALISAIDGTDSSFIGSGIRRLPEGQYGLSGTHYRRALKTGGRHRELPVVYLSYTRFAQSRSSALSLADVALPNRVSEVSYQQENGPFITAIFEQKKESAPSGGEYWIFRGMSLCPFLEGKTVQMADAALRLSPAGAEGGIPFEVVRFLPFHMEFYRFTYGGKSYFSPAQPYAGLLEGSARMDVRLAWPEGEILRLLMEKTKALEARKLLLAELANR